MEFEDKLVITERGRPGNLCIEHECSFRRNTLIEYGDKKWIVSTVGGYYNRLKNKKDTIGYNRWYETMAFEAEFIDGYWDANVSKEIDFDSSWGLFAETWDELLQTYPYPDNAANDMHDAVVKELTIKIKEI
jgi:hypothetical protein